jgi:sialate O-acetylesterase
LALLALRHLYGQRLLADAPRMAEAQRVGTRVKIRFRHAGEGLTIEGPEVDDLRLHCGDRALPFVAHAEGDCLVLDLRREPASELSVSYGQSNMHCLNLYNSAHIPALPFVMCC